MQRVARRGTLPGRVDAAHRRKTERRAGRRDAVFGHRFRPRAERSADRHGAERIRQVDAVADNRRAAAARRRNVAAGRRRRGLAIGGGGLPLSRPPQRHEDRADRRGKSAILAAFPRRAAARRRCRARPGRTGRHRPFAVRLSVGRPAAPRRDCPAAGQPPPGLAARRADRRPRRALGPGIRVADAGASGRRRHRDCGNASGAGDRGSANGLRLGEVN